jgi:hypothetical protein
MALAGTWRAMTVVSCVALLAQAGGRHTSSDAVPNPAALALPHAAPPMPKVEEATPIAIQKDELGKPTWNPAWDQIVDDALPPELLSSRVARDVRPFCPRFKRMDDTERRAFWTYFFQALAGAEAGLQPTSDVRHPEMDMRDTVTRRMVRAEGLLQLTYMDADPYGCDFHWEKDKDLPHKDPAKTILQPENNLTCGVKILDDQLIARKERLLSRTSYWETLRPGTAGYKVFLKQMTNVPAACRIPKSSREERVEAKERTTPGPAARGEMRTTAASMR